jgi:serine/threonine protein phosphatase 1
MRPRTIAIGDIHGCSLALESLLAAIQPRPDDTIITLGDYVNRGPDSRGVLDRLIELEGQCTLIPILGNHDQTLLAALAGQPRALSDLLDMGGGPTLMSYGAGRISEADLVRIPADHCAFLGRCRDCHETETHFFLHAQYDPDVPMDEQSSLWLRWQSLRDGIPDAHVSGKRAIVGHSSYRRAARSWTWATWFASTRSATAAAG